MTKDVPRVLALLSACLVLLAAIAAGAVAPATCVAAVSPYLRAPTVTIAAGGSHTVVLRANGRLQAWGANLQGQLGDNTTTQRLTPTWVGTDTDWVAIACGANHTVALKANGSLYAWGQNLDGQLGVNDTTGRLVPTRVGTATDWVAVACGSFHTVALKADGTLWTWGDNAYGQLGLDDTTDRKTPVQLGGGTNWSFVAAGGWHTLAVKSTGQLYAWGRNDYGQLGDGAGVEWHHPIRMTDFTDWVAVSGGAYHSAGLRANGALYTWGRNNYGQLGLGNTTNVNVPTQVGKEQTWVGVACGYQHTLGLVTTGAAYGWGYGAYGQVGDGGTTDRTSPTIVKSTLTFASLAAGGNHGGAVIADGSVAMWGYNASGQIGNGTTTNRTGPTSVLASGLVWPAPRSHRGETERVAAGGDHSVALKSDGSLWGWGDNDEGQVGDGTRSDRTSPVPVGGAGLWRSVASGSAFTAGVRHDGSLYAWGANDRGQLGLTLAYGARAVTPQRVGASNNWVAVATGRVHALALRCDGSLWSWGDNAYGQLGSGDLTVRDVPTRVGTANDWVAIGAGQRSSYAVKADGSLYSWGWNVLGQLGIGSTTDQSLPVRVGTANTWTGVAGGRTHALGLKVNGELYAWGWGAVGQLGNGSRDTVSAPVAVNPLAGWVAVAGLTDGDFSVGVRADATMHAWGSNGAGQLGDGTTTDRLLPVYVEYGCSAAAAGEIHTLAATSAGDLYATGYNTSGQLGNGWLYGEVWPRFMLRLYDLDAPTIASLASSSHPSPSTWYSNASVDVQWAGADAHGLLGYSLAFEASPVVPDGIFEATGTATSASTTLGDGIWYFSIAARDFGGLWSPAVSREIRIDTTEPTAPGPITSPSHPSELEWYRDSTPTLEWGASVDAASGVTGYSWNIALLPSGDPPPDSIIDGTGTAVTLGPLVDGRWIFGVCAFDAAKNRGDGAYRDVLIDTTPPVTTDDADEEWHRGPVTVTLTPKDAHSGVWYTVYDVDGGPQRHGRTVTLRTWKRGGNSGEHVIRYYSGDFAYNDELPRYCTVKLDAKPPRTLCDAPAEPTPAPLTVSLTATDAHSGVSVTRYTSDPASGWLDGDVVDYASPGTYTLYYYSTDYAGNVELVRSRTFTVLSAASPRDLPKRSLKLR